MSCGSIDFTPAMPGPARRRVGDNAGGGGRRWGQSGSGALGPAKAGPAVAEIGRVPRRDRSGSVPRSVQFRTEIGSTAARPGAGAARWAFRREVGISVRVRRRRRRTRTEMSTSTGTRPCAGGSRSPRAPDRAAPGPTSTAGSYPTPHGRTQIHEVVPGLARSYLKAPPTVRPGAAAYDHAHSCTTARTRVRPARGNGRRPRRTYDRTSNGTTARPSHRTRPHPTHHPHTPTTATHPDRKPHSTSVRRPPPASSRTASPHNHDNRTELEPELDRTRAGTEPNSTKESEGEGRRRWPARAGHRHRRLTRSRGSP